MKLKFLLLALILIIPNTVNASEIYFENNNGVSLTKKEYDYLVERFSENFLKIMTNNDYDNLVSDELLSGKMNVNTSIPTIMPLSESYYKTGSKYIKITSICSSINCSITVYVKWYNEPKVKSYDVIGAYFQNTSLKSSPVTYISNLSTTTYSNEIVNQSKGFGVSIKVPNGSNIELYQYYDTKPGGMINASYQHAKSSISLNNSKKYTISNSGYGGVFLFDSSVKEKYDAMSGVSINL